MRLSFPAPNRDRVVAGVDPPVRSPLPRMAVVVLSATVAMEVEAAVPSVTAEAVVADLSVAAAMVAAVAAPPAAVVAVADADAHSSSTNPYS